MYKRKQLLADADGNSLFLWGVRQCGKSTLLMQLYPNAVMLDLLNTDLCRQLTQRPALLREMALATQTNIIVIDEVQKVPELLNEVHWLIENTKHQYILSGFSPRKIIKQGVNLLGGRALRYELYPLSYSEIPDFDLLQALNRGLIPRHYDSKIFEKLIGAYIGAYLEEEIIAESKIRNTAVFIGFMEKAAFGNGEMINYTNIATDCGISSPTVKEYYNILCDTMIGTYVQAFTKKPKRRVILAPKFYLFDIGIANFLLKRKNIQVGTDHFGFAFEHFIYLEIKAYSSYSAKNFDIKYWRTASQIEVDFILGDHQAAIEIKGSTNVQLRHLKGLKAFNEEYDVPLNIVVSNEEYPRQVGNISILPWKIFLKKLWDGEVI